MLLFPITSVDLKSFVSSTETRAHTSAARVLSPVFHKGTDGLIYQLTISCIGIHSSFSLSS
jgi:hypothetical protein